jgi:hypothetical protein
MALSAYVESPSSCILLPSVPSCFAANCLSQNRNHPARLLDQHIFILVIFCEDEEVLSDDPIG